jgi:hypothetical protein
MALPLISLLMGMVLGQRFKVLVLVPALAFVLVVAVGAGVARVQGLWPTALMAAGAVASLQIGYLGGTGLRHVIAAARISKLRTAFQGGPEAVARNARSPAL